VRWPDIWGLNKDQIKNPHWIYPGDVILLDFTGMTHGCACRASTAPPTGVWWSPSSVRRYANWISAASAIPSIPLEAIAPFLTNRFVVGEGEMSGAPILVAGQENRVILSAGDTPTPKAWSLRMARSGTYIARAAIWSIRTPRNCSARAVHLGELKVSQFGERQQGCDHQNRSWKLPPATAW